MKITIIVPTFQRLTYLKQALDSICQQTYQDFDCLVVNDYPPDSEVIEDAIAKLNDPRIRLINHEQSYGGNAARNTGIKASQGDIIAFLDDDDWWLPDKLQKHVEKHQQNLQAGLIFSGVTKKWENEHLPPKTFKAELPENGVQEAMSQGQFCPATTSSVTVLKECFDRCGLFDRDLVSFQDWDMWYRIAHHYDFDCIDESLLVFRQHLGDRTSGSKERRLQGLEQLVNKWQSSLSDPQKFKNFFIKNTYVASVYNSILNSQKTVSLSDFYKLLILSKQLSDIVLLFKLILMWTIGIKAYGRISRLYNI